MSKNTWTKIKEILSGNKTDKEINLRGWIYRTRSSGNITFITMRDSTGRVKDAVVL